MALERWLTACDIRDENGHRVHVTPHQWRHTLGTRLNLRGIASDASFGSRLERCDSVDLGVRRQLPSRSGSCLTRPVSCVDAQHPTDRMHWVQR